MKIKVYPGDDGGVGRYRLRYPAEALQAAGYDVEIAAPGDDDFKFIQLQEADGSLTVAAMDPTAFPDADMIVIQRPVIDTTWQFIRAFQQHGIRVAVDMDDNFDALHPNNPAAVAIRKHHPRLSPKNVHRAIAQADALIVSTPELARVYGKDAKRVTVCENRVPASWLTIPKRESNAIGWSGTTRYHIGDIEQLGPTLGRLQDIGRDVHIVGPEPEPARFGLTETGDVYGMGADRRLRLVHGRRRRRCCPARAHQVQRREIMVEGVGVRGGRCPHHRLPDPGVSAPVRGRADHGTRSEAEGLVSAVA